MHTPCSSHWPAYGKRCKDMAGHDDSAISKTKHGNEYAKINDCLQNTQQLIFSLEQIAIPPDVEDMMCDKQKQHPGTEPLMKLLPGDLICHQAEQQHCHQEINSHLDFHFWFHESFTLSHHLDKPSSATHSFTLFSASVTLEPPI